MGARWQMLRGVRHGLVVLLAAAAATSFAPSAALAQASGVPVAAPGGAKMASATPLTAGLTESGSVRARTTAWYSLERAGAPTALIEVGSSSKSCPARFSIVESRGHTLSEIIASSSEELPFSTPLRARSRGGVYYVRIDVDPFRRCGQADYQLVLLEPAQADPCTGVPVLPSSCRPVIEVPGVGGGAGGGGGTLERTAPPPTRGGVPPLVVKACTASLSALRHLTIAVEIARARYREHRESASALRSLEARKLAMRRKQRALCGY